MKPTLIWILTFSLLVGQVMALEVKVHYLQQEMKNEVAITGQITNNIDGIVNFLKQRR